METVIELGQGHAPPVQFSPAMRRWSVTGHAAARDILRDPSFRTDGLLSDMLTRLERAGSRFPALRRLLPAIIVFADPPDHAPARRRLARLLGYRPLTDQLPAITARVATLLAAGRRHGRFDLVADFARPLSVGTIADVLGLDPADADTLAAGSAHLVELLEIMLPLRRFRELDAVAADMLAVAHRVIAERRLAPRDDSLSRAVLERTDWPDDDSLAAACVFAFMAGVETSLSSVSGAIRTVFTNPSARAALQADPSLIPAMVEHLLRLHSAIQTVIRVATEPRDIGGVTIPAGAAITISLAAANRDPASFPAGACPMTQPASAPHLAFGERQHYCLGASLARTLVATAITGFLDLPSVTLLTEAEAWADRGTTRSLLALPVLLG